MKKCIWILVVVCIGMVGCIPRHFTHKSDQFVKLYLRVPSASKVQFASSVDHYQVHAIEKNRLGLWEVRVPRHLEFKYFYVVDDLVFLPDCRFKERDDFGTQNCIYQP